jgi:Zn-dependent protease
MGMPVSLPVFIPGFGAFVTVPQAKTMTLDAVGALAGPLLGSAAAALCYVYGLANGDQFWIACAHIGFLLNLFNLAPVPPLDGGRVIGILSPRLWLVGIVGAAAFIVFSHALSGITSLLLIVLMLAFLPRAWAAWKGRLDPAYLDVPIRDRIAVGATYFALAALLAVGMAYTSPHIPNGGL